MSHAILICAILVFSGFWLWVQWRAVRALGTSIGLIFAGIAELFVVAAISGLAGPTMDALHPQGPPQGVDFLYVSPGLLSLMGLTLFLISVAGLNILTALIVGLVSRDPATRE